MNAFLAAYCRNKGAVIGTMILLLVYVTTRWSSRRIWNATSPTAVSTAKAAYQAPQDQASTGPMPWHWPATQDSGTLMYLPDQQPTLRCMRRWNDWTNGPSVIPIAVEAL